MAELKVWFLDVGHGDCTYVLFPNGAKMLIDCGDSGDHWPSRLLKHTGLTRPGGRTPGEEERKDILDYLVITHPHADHMEDIEAIYNNVGFRWFQGGYGALIERITPEQIDFRGRGRGIAESFISIVREYVDGYAEDEDRIAANDPAPIMKWHRFIEYEPGMDLNDLSWLGTIEMGGRKILFTGDMTAAGVRKILDSPRADEFRTFVEGTAVLKAPLHGRENGCSREMFDLFGAPPVLCVLSDGILNEGNEGIPQTEWYADRTDERGLPIDGMLWARRVLTTRQDRDVYLRISDTGEMVAYTRAFTNIRETILS
jgi:competence protein ComEC